MELLEDRTLLTGQVVDLGPLRFSAESFDQQGSTYSATGTIEVGFVPSGAEAFVPVAEIEGSLQFTVGVPDLKFTVESGAIAAPPGASALSLWSTSTPFDFDVADLVGSGVELATGGKTFTVDFAVFTPGNISFVNPSAPDTSDSQVWLQGDLTLSSFTGLSVPVSGDAYVTIDATGASLNPFATSVTTTFDLMGLTIAPTSLAFSYTTADSSPQFEISGGFNLTTADGGLVAVPSNFGPPNNPGLIYANGVVTQANIGLPQAFEIFQLPLTQTGSIPMQFVLNEGEFQAFGAVTFPVPGDVDSTLSATAGSSDTPGMVISNGLIQKVALAVQPQEIFELFGLPTQADGLALDLDPAKAQFAMTGSISLPFLLLVSAELGGNGEPSLIFKDGDWKVPDLAISLTDVYLGAFVLDDLMLNFMETSDGVSFGVALKLWFPIGMVFGGNVEFDGQGHLEDIGVSFSGGMLAVSDTGIFITGFSASLQNLDHPENLVVSGSLTAVYGDQFDLAGVMVTPIKVTGSFTADKDQLVLGAVVYMGAYTPPTGSPNGLLGEGTGTLTLDWAAHNYSLDVHLEWYDDIFSIDAIIDLSGNGDDLFVKAQADVNVPDIIPFIGGHHIAGVDFALEYHKNQPLSQSFVAAWVSVDLIFHTFDIGVMVDFNKHVSVIGNSQVDAINQSNNSQNQVYNYYAQFVVPEGATHATLGVDWVNPYNFVRQSIAVLPPNQSVPIQENQFSDANGIMLTTAYFGPGFNNAVVDIVGSSNDPDVPLPAGVYQLILTSKDVPISDPIFSGLFGFTTPTITLGELPEAPIASFPIPITSTVDLSFAGTTKISLFYDDDGSGYDGTPIPGLTNLPFSPSMAPVWDPSRLLPTIHFLYAEINDGTNTPVYSVYTNAFTPSPPLHGILTDPIHADIPLSGLTVFLDADGNGLFDAASDPNTTTSPQGYYSFTTPQLPVNKTIAVGVVIPPGFVLDTNSSNLVPVTYDGAQATIVNFGLDQRSSIQGTVFNDVNQNGEQDPGEATLPGWSVTLTDASGSATILTDSAGRYAFRNVKDGTYTVSLALQGHTYLSQPGSPGTYTVSISGDYQVVTGKNFDVLEYSTVAGTLTGQAILNGVLEPRTVPLAGWDVHLLAGSVAIDAGSTTGAGPYQADVGFSTSLTASTAQAIDLSNVVDPAPQAVYQTNRFAKAFTYTVTGLTPGARYSVRLHFAETFWNGPSQRVFDVAINGTQVLSNFDIFVAAGSAMNTAVVKSAKAVADVNGTITIGFQASVDNAQINGIEVGRVAARIDAGGGAVGDFEADTGSGVGQIATTTNPIDLSTVSDPAPEAVYQSNRYAAYFPYTVGGLTPGARYSVRLHFAEYAFSAPGQRVFDVRINGLTVLSDFDIFAEAGGDNIAVARTFEAIADGSGTIDLQFEASVNNAQVNGIEIDELIASTTTDVRGNYAFGAIQAAIAAGSTTGSGIYQADRGFSPSSTFSTTSPIATYGVLDPAPQAVYQNYRFGKSFTYEIDELTPGASYTVRLDFAESFWTGPQMRVFDVAINGQTVLANFDIFAEAGGADIAVARAFSAVADSGGSIHLQFNTSVDNAQINGIQILQAGGLRPGTYEVRVVEQPGWRQFAPFASDLQLTTPSGPDIIAVNDQPIAVNTADYNGDGILDVASLIGGNQIVIVDGGSGAQSSIPLNFTGSLMVTGDFTGTGRPSFALLDLIDGLVFLMVNQGGGQFIPANLWTVAGLGNYEFDSNPQMTVGPYLTGNAGDALSIVYPFYPARNEPMFFNEQVTLYVDGSGNSRYVTTQNSGLPQFDSLAGAITVDLFGEGTPDLLIADRIGGPVVGIGQGDGTFQFLQLGSLPAGTSAVAGDMNGDGFVDLGVFDNNGLFTYGLQNSSFSLYIVVPTQVGSPGYTINSASLQDMNGDLRPDLVWVVGRIGSQSLFVALNTGVDSALFAPAQQTSWSLAGGGQDGLTFAIGDLDRDGLPDLVVAEEGAQIIEVVRNQSLFFAAPIFTTLTGSVAIPGGSVSSGNNVLQLAIGQINGRIFDDVTRDGHDRASKPGRAGATAFVDLNRNGQHDPGEPMSSVGADGHYAFSGLANGSYLVRTLPESGRTLTTPASDHYEVSIGTTRPVAADLNFGSAVGLDLVWDIPRDSGSGDWSLARQGNRLVAFDRVTGVVGAALLSEVHSLTIVAPDGRAGSLTVDQASGGFFALPGGLTFRGGSDQGDSLRILVGAANDRVSVASRSAGDDGSVILNAGSMVFWVGVESVAIDTGAGADRVTVAGAGGTSLTIRAGDGDDTVSIDFVTAPITVDGQGGDDRLTASTDPAAVLVGVTLIGGDGADYLQGGAHGDTLIGGPGGDVVLGGPGDDLMIWNDGDGSDQFDGEAGVDMVVVTTSDTQPDQVIIRPNGSRATISVSNDRAFSLDVGTTEVITVRTGGGGDSIQVTPLVTTAVNIDGGSTSSSGGDRLDVHVQGFADPRFVYLGPLSGRWTFSGANAVTFTNVASFNASQPVPYVLGLFRAVLGRDPQADELNFWAVSIDAGATPLDVARGFWESPEHRTIQVEQYYTSYLHRPAAPSEKAYWVTAMLGGVSESTVVRRILTSPEYLASHRGVRNYVTALYQDVIGRPPARRDLSNWLRAARHGLGYGALAKRILTSKAAAKRLVSVDYQSILGRSPSGREVATWTSRLRSGRDTPSSIAERFLASSEFRARFD